MANVNNEQLDRMHSGKGFIAALDQSGGSTPKALSQYGVQENSYSNDEEMYTLVHEMRTRIIKRLRKTKYHYNGNCSDYFQFCYFRSDFSGN